MSTDNEDILSLEKKLAEWMDPDKCPFCGLKKSEMAGLEYLVKKMAGVLESIITSSPLSCCREDAIIDGFWHCTICHGGGYGILNIKHMKGCWIEKIQDILACQEIKNIIEKSNK